VWWNISLFLCYKFTAESVLKELLKLLNWQTYVKSFLLKRPLRRGIVTLKDEEFA